MCIFASNSTYGIWVHFRDLHMCYCQLWELSKLTSESMALEVDNYFWSWFLDSQQRCKITVYLSFHTNIFNLNVFDYLILESGHQSIRNLSQIRQYLVRLLSLQMFRSVPICSEKEGQDRTIDSLDSWRDIWKELALKCFALQKCPFLKIQLRQEARPVPSSLFCNHDDQRGSPTTISQTIAHHLSISHLKLWSAH